MRKLLFLAISAAVLVACGNKTANNNADATSSEATDTVASVVGAWVQPIEGQDSVQGMNLKDDKTAESINMSTLTVEAWDQKGDSLIIVATSKGNGQEFKDTMTYKIETLTNDSLVLKDANGGTQAYSKK